MIYYLSLEKLHRLPYEWLPAAPQHQVDLAFGYLSVVAEERADATARAIEAATPAGRNVNRALAAIARLEAARSTPGEQAI